MELDGKLKTEKSLTGVDGVTLDSERVFIPVKQRRRVGVHLHYPVKSDFGPDEPKADRRKKIVPNGD